MDFHEPFELTTLHGIHFRQCEDISEEPASSYFDRLRVIYYYNFTETLTYKLMNIIIEITYMNSHIHNIINENSTFIVHLP